MAFQQRARAPQDYGRRHERSGHERAKAKAARKKRRSSRSQGLEEMHVPTQEEVVDRTLNSLRILGNQKFALPPFYEHFSRWLIDLENVLSEFKSSSTISMDGQFVKERSQILSNIRAQLDKAKRKEVSREEAARNLSDNRFLLERIEKEYIAKMKEIEERKNREINRLSHNVDSIEEELDRISQMKAGILRAVSKKDKIQKETEATQKLNLAQSNLKSTEQNFISAQVKLREEYERKKQLITKQIQDFQKRVQNQESDLSLKNRQAACESLANAINALPQRNT
jgi:vacuolar-type H+-ATPase subunit I/STV1